MGSGVLGTVSIIMIRDYFKHLSPVFLLGIARSGTTLLQSLLDGHPQLLVDVADSNFYRWYRQYYRWIDRIHTWPDNNKKRAAMAESVMIDHIFNEKSHYYRDFLSNISISELKGHFHTLLHSSLGQPADFLEAYFHALGLASGHLTSQTGYWVDKTLSYEYLFYRYLQWWPDAHFIYMVRDPRDVYTSYKKRDIRSDRSVTGIDTLALKWGNSVHTLLNCQGMVAPENCFILRYEDLIQNPQKVMQSIAQFLRIEFLPGLLVPTKGFGKVPWSGNAVSGKKQQGIFQDASNKWLHSLRVQEVSAIEGLLHDEMEAVGYSLSQAVQNTPLLSVKLWAHRIFFQFLNLGL
jgi:hypothetical protein